MVTEPHNASASSAGFVSCASCRHRILSFLWPTEQDPVMELGFESCTRKTGDFCKRCKREFGKKSGNPPPEKNQFRIGGPSVISRRLGGFLALSITFWLIMSGNGSLQEFDTSASTSLFQWKFGRITRLIFSTKRGGTYPPRPPLAPPVVGTKRRAGVREIGWSHECHTLSER